MDNELAVALPRAEIELLRSTAEELGISPGELAAKLLSDELHQRCSVPVAMARVINIPGPEKGDSRGRG